jgi:hypothetical protein
MKLWGDRMGRLVCLRVICLLLMASLGNGPAAAQVPSDSELNAALDPYFQCLVATRRKIDDGISDASSVAIALISFCSAPLQNYVILLERKNQMGDYMRLIFERNFRAQQVGFVTGIVLQERAKSH